MINHSNLILAKLKKKPITFENNKRESESQSWKEFSIKTLQTFSTGGLQLLSLKRKSKLFIKV